ncbi:GTPase Era [Buchnera aphidicola]|uniref:GTPase Era n=1 Tax=Buchnera aphidicola TaxID=9 RepID=UPI0031B80EF5
MKSQDSYCGKIIIIGQTNVGKSTIINKLLQQKMSITSKKPGTTNQNILFVKTLNKHQFIYIDTPGINKKYNILLKNNILNHKKMQLILFVINQTFWSEQEEIILKKIKKKLIPIILIINKIDLMKCKKILLPFVEKITAKHQFKHIIPISAKKKKHILILQKMIKKNIPQSNHIYPIRYITNLNKNFFISEFIREKFIKFLNKEIPYLIKIKIDQCYIDKQNIYNIYASLIIPLPRIKKIIIGEKGKKIKNCIFLAKKTIKKYLNQDVKLYVKIKINK